MSKEKIGILGGTFNPIHEGHLYIAQTAMKQAGLDRVLIIPSGNPPHKADIAPKEARWQMVTAACAADAHLQPLRLELDREGPTYAYDTVLQLREMYPKASFFYIVGEDVLPGLEHWYAAQNLMSLCRFLICPRPDEKLPHGVKKHLRSLGARLETVKMSPVSISSSAIRDDLRNGKIPKGLTPAVLEYCRCRGLYGWPLEIEEAPAWLDRLFETLNPRRFAHSLGVSCTCRHLAERHGLDLLRAVEAGLLHDCSKCIPLPQMQQLARAYHLTEDETILDNSGLLHALTGVPVAEKEYGMHDPLVLEAIAYHNTGREGMTLLDMCVCLSDSIEPGRKSYPLLEEIRALSEENLPLALLRSLESTVAYVRENGWFLHPQTAATVAWLKTVCQ